MPLFIEWKYGRMELNAIQQFKRKPKHFAITVSGHKAGRKEKVYTEIVEFISLLMNAGIPFLTVITETPEQKGIQSCEWIIGIVLTIFFV